MTRTIYLIAKKDFGSTNIGDVGVLNIAMDSLVVSTKNDSLIYTNIEHVREEWKLCI